MRIVTDVLFVLVASAISCQSLPGAPQGDHRANKARGSDGGADIEKGSQPNMSPQIVKLSSYNPADSGGGADCYVVLRPISNIITITYSELTNNRVQLTFEPVGQNFRLMKDSGSPDCIVLSDGTKYQMVLDGFNDKVSVDLTSGVNHVLNWDSHVTPVYLPGVGGYFDGSDNLSVQAIWLKDVLMTHTHKLIISYHGRTVPLVIDPNPCS
jgi:hypothetical protein